MTNSLINKNIFENIIEIDQNNQIFKDDFTSLWKNITDSFKFFKIPINIDNEKYMQLQLDIKYNNCCLKINYDQDIYNQIIKYNKTIGNLYFNDLYKIILVEKNYIVVSNKNFEYGNIFVTQDYYFPSRYLICFTHNCGTLSYKINGIIVYFDSNGEMVNKNILYRELCIFDCRNGFIDDKKIIFYNRTLLFYQIHRDTGELFLFENLFDWKDNLIFNNKTHHTSIICSNFTELKQGAQEISEKYNLNNRFYYLTNFDKTKHIFLDLDSLDLLDYTDYVLNIDQKDKLNNTSNYLTNLTNYLSSSIKSIKSIKSIQSTQSTQSSKTLKKIIKLNYYVLNSLDAINNFILYASNLKEKEFVGEYPLNCPKCLALTSIARFEKFNGFSTTMYELGESFCLTCKIRYSKSKNSWICCKFLNSNNYSCDKKLNESNNFTCSNDHSMINEYKVTRRVDTFIFPYKNKIILSDNLSDTL